MIVLDASALVEVLLGRAEAVEDVVRELGDAKNQVLVIEPETLNALRRLVRARAITQHRAEQAVVHLGATRLIRYPHGPLRSRVWSLRDSLSAHDATYVALAEALDDAVLLTADRGLAIFAEHALGRPRVRLLA